MWLYRTNKGRVVYTRRTHSFKWRDLLRIYCQLRDPIPGVDDTPLYTTDIKQIEKAQYRAALQFLMLYDMRWHTSLTMTGFPVDREFNVILNFIYERTGITPHDMRVFIRKWGTKKILLALIPKGG